MKETRLMLTIYRGKEEGKMDVSSKLKSFRVVFEFPYMSYILLIFFRDLKHIFMIIPIHCKISLLENEEQNEETLTFTLKFTS